MAGRVSGKAQLAIGIAAMAATITAIYPARGETPLDSEPHAGGLVGSLQQVETRMPGSSKTI